MNERDLVYKPINSELKCQNAILGVKFSNDIVIAESLLKQWNVPYNEHDLEEGPWGKCLRIKRNNK